VPYFPGCTIASIATVTARITGIILIGLDLHTV